MDSSINLEGYLSDSIDNIVKSAVRASLKNPKESLFIAKFAFSSKEAELIRNRNEKAGIHIPPFLICSITDSCNLHCTGCYARANHSRRSGKKEPLDILEWKRIFQEAEEAGISFILLAGGEPLMRPEVIEAAAEFKKIMFAVFTNGTLFTEKLIHLFDKNRNLLPILSIEGDLEFTDARRGVGIYNTTGDIMHKLLERGIFYGVSITATC
jgi:MoaA/NifB/PqqE/SkfB family radical SAM enzyme